MQEAKVFAAEYRERIGQIKNAADSKAADTHKPASRIASLFKDEGGSTSINVALFGLPNIVRTFGEFPQKEDNSKQRNASASSANGLELGSKETPMLSKLRTLLRKHQRSACNPRILKRSRSTVLASKAMQKLGASKDLQRLRAANVVKLDTTSRREAKDAAQKLKKRESKLHQQDQNKAASPPAPKGKFPSTLPDSSPPDKQAIKQADAQHDNVRHVARPSARNADPISSKSSNNSPPQNAAQSFRAGERNQSHDVKRSTEAPQSASPNQDTSSSKQPPPAQPATTSSEKKAGQIEQPSTSGVDPTLGNNTTKPTEPTRGAQAKHNSNPVSNTPKPEETVKPTAPTAPTQPQTKSVVTDDGQKTEVAAATPQPNPASSVSTLKPSETEKAPRDITTANAHPKGRTPTDPKPSSSTVQSPQTPSQQVSAIPKAAVPTQETQHASAAPKAVTSNAQSVAAVVPKSALASPMPSQTQPPPPQQKVGAPPRNISPPPPPPRRIPPTPAPAPPPQPRRSR